MRIDMPTVELIHSPVGVVQCTEFCIRFHAGKHGYVEGSLDHEAMTSMIEEDIEPVDTEVAERLYDLLHSLTK